MKGLLKNIEESEESDDDDDKSNITYDENDFKEAYENVMENENINENITNNEGQKSKS